MACLGKSCKVLSFQYISEIIRWDLREIAILLSLWSRESRKEHMQCSMSISEENSRISYLSCRFLERSAVQLSTANCVLDLSKPSLEPWGFVSDLGSILPLRPKRLVSPWLSLFPLSKLVANLLVLVRILNLHHGIGRSLLTTMSAFASSGSCWSRKSSGQRALFLTAVIGFKIFSSSVALVVVRRTRWLAPEASSFPLRTLPCPLRCSSL